MTQVSVIYTNDEIQGCIDAANEEYVAWGKEEISIESLQKDDMLEMFLDEMKEYGLHWEGEGQEMANGWLEEYFD